MRIYTAKRKHLAIAALGLFLALLAGEWQACRADLLDYVKRADNHFQWKLANTEETPDGVIYNLDLVSQEWQGIVWKHKMQVFLPRGVEPGATMFLWNQGGNPSDGSRAMGMLYAKTMKVPVVFLYGIPNQPLLGGKKEDALIAETFVRYLNTKDENWPLLFPMVKSLVKAMDAIQEFAKQEWNVEVRTFIVSGGSKRGWTTWLTAVADPRVQAIAPLVIDTLNMKAQMPHQRESYGDYSSQINDYTERGLVPMPKTPEAERLWRMVDPWTYRDKLTLPRMIINGGNDPYWSVDALNLYWDDLKGDQKWVLYVPNAGHDLAQVKENGKKDRDRAINTLCAFVRHQIQKQPMPQLNWKHDDANGKHRLTVTASTQPTGARLWVVNAPTKDFRTSKWVEHPVEIADDGTIRGTIDPPANGFQAFFMELDYSIDGLPYHLSTQMRVSGKK